MKERYILTESLLYQTFESKGLAYDLSMVNTNNHINISDIEVTMREIKLRNFPLTDLIIGAIERKQLVLTVSDKATSSVQLLPAVDKDGKIAKVFINVALLVKKEKIVDTNTGDIKEIMSIKNFQDLYNVLLGGYVALNAERVINNRPAMKLVAESYTDIVSQIISKSMGNPIDGDKLRFLIKVFLYNGLVSGMDLSESERFNKDAALLMNSRYPDFFAKKSKTIADLLNVVKDEFPNLKNVSVERFMDEAIKVLGSNAACFVDNIPYMLSVIVCRTRKDKIVFTGYALRLIDPYAAKIITEILNSVY